LELDEKNEKYMMLAIEKAIEGVEKGQEPFGACVVKDDEVISVCYNTVLTDNDVTAHAEINAIRKASKELGTVDLSGCIVYASFKPCQMCFEACKRANISTIFYGAGPSDVKYSIKREAPIMIGGVMKEACLQLVSQKYLPK
jgi:tRNA(Arg) A34 adenosine deaminase TadA